MSIPPYVLPSDVERFRGLSDEQLSQEWKDATNDPAIRAMMRLQAIENEKARRMTAAKTATDAVAIALTRAQIRTVANERIHRSDAEKVKMRMPTLPGTQQGAGEAMRRYVQKRRRKRVLIAIALILMLGAVAYQWRLELSNVVFKL